VVLTRDCPAVGRTLRELALEMQGGSVPTLVREGRRHDEPTPDQVLPAGDALVLLGSDEDLDRAESRLTGSPPD